MSTETEINKAKKVAMAKALAGALKKHPKKSMACGIALMLVGAVLEFSDPLCAMIPNAIGQVVCKGAAQVGNAVFDAVDENGQPESVELETVTVESGSEDAGQ